MIVNHFTKEHVPTWRPQPLRSFEDTRIASSSGSRKMSHAMGSSVFRKLHLTCDSSGSCSILLIPSLSVYRSYSTNRQDQQTNGNLLVTHMLRTSTPVACTLWEIELFLPRPLNLIMEQMCRATCQRMVAVSTIVQHPTNHA